MTERDFCYWLQGFFEIQEPRQIDAKATEMIRKHLQLVFRQEVKTSGYAQIGTIQTPPILGDVKWHNQERKLCTSTPYEGTNSENPWVNMIFEGSC